MGDPKIFQPMRWATSEPAANPAAAPATASKPASTRKREATAKLLAPRDFIRPTSWRRPRRDVPPPEQNPPAKTDQAPIFRNKNSPEITAHHFPCFFSTSPFFSANSATTPP